MWYNNFMRAFSVFLIVFLLPLFSFAQEDNDFSIEELRKLEDIEMIRRDLKGDMSIPSNLQEKLELKLDNYATKDGLFNEGDEIVTE